ncbi:retrotransposon protein, putative, ty1-copia subclass, partial [Tanacetum coccineum]
KTFFEREKLTGDNFNDWYRSLRIVLRVAGIDRNFNKPCVGKIVSDLHALLIDYEKGLKDKAPTPQLVTGRGTALFTSKSSEHGAATSAQAAIEAIGVFNLVLPSRLVLSLNNCHYAPSIVRCVVFISCLSDLGFVHTVTHNGISVSLNGIFYFSAISMNGVFEIDMNDNVSKYNNNSIFSINKKRKLDLNSSYLWHCRLAHIGKTRMQKLQREGLLESINDGSYDKCESCISGKMTKKPFNNNIERATDLLGLIHTDVCGPFRHVSRKGASYFLTFTDDFSRYGYVYLLKHKHEVFETFKVFKSEVELQLGKKIKALRSDRGGEYLSQEFKDYLGKNGIVQHLTSPYTPQQNGVSERRNRTLLDMVRSMFNLTTLPLSFWDYALESAVRILNMVPTKKVDKTPYEIWHGKETMGYYFYFPPENKVIVARYGDFLERDLISQEFSGRDYDLEDDHMDTLPSENTSEIPVEPESLGPPPELIPIRRSERNKSAPNRLNLNIEVEDDVVGDLGEPANYKAAMLDPDKSGYPPPNAKVVRSKWLFKKKTDMDGEVHTYKARLVAKGCTQTYGIDYEETFSPVADIRAIRILIAIAAYYDYEIWQMDVKTAFLEWSLDDDILYGANLRKFNMHNSKKGYLPMEVKHELSNEMCASTPEEVAYMKKVPYASANPGKLHWVAVKHILKYLRNTRDMFLVYGGKPDTELNVTGFCDASWQSDKDDTKSQTGYVFVVNGGAVDWKSKKQTTIAMSATQAEYMAASEAAMEAVWIRKFVGDLGSVLQ